MLPAAHGEDLAEARARTLWLVEPVREEDMDRVQSTLLSPLTWDLGHIAAFEDLWLCRSLGAVRPDLMEVYDATETPRSGRGDLPYLRVAEARDYMARVRERALGVLDRVDPFIAEMVLQHEHQHNETMLQALALAEPGTYAPPRRPLPPAPAAERPGMVRVESGPFLAGDPGDGFAYDNERPQHEVDIAAFEIDRLPVTNGDYLDFVAEGGYSRRELWSQDGWAWREAEGVERPLYWTADGGERRFERIEALDPSLPVMHVSWYEADAYARWAGKRLPTELEWEKAASWDPAAERKRRYPWGDHPPGLPARGVPGGVILQRANLDQLAFGPAPAGAYPAGASAYGVLGMLGDAWEWTSSPFTGYPGFSPYPYEEYSSIFFGDGYRVLRGASWATRPRVARNTFRNWDYPQRRQIFAGFRCARDA